MPLEFITLYRMPITVVLWLGIVMCIMAHRAITFQVIGNMAAMDIPVTATAIAVIIDSND
jgi:hypothetical protein